jgi:hypothetical protein
MSVQRDLQFADLMVELYYSNFNDQNETQPSSAYVRQQSTKQSMHFPQNWRFEVEKYPQFNHASFNGRNCYTRRHFRIARYTIVKPSVFPTYTRKFSPGRHWGQSLLVDSLPFSRPIIVYAMSMSGVRCRIEHFGSAGLDYVCRIAWGNISRKKKTRVQSYVTWHAQE